MKLILSELFHRDDLQNDEAKKASDLLKSENLRAGNSGLMLPDGNVTGNCPRKAYLRLRGVDMPISSDRSIMFEFGRENETIIIDKLKRQIGGTFLITGDDVNKFAWKLPSGRVVSGSPDVIISDKAGNPLLCLELKLICSLWTARSVVFGNEPKLGHIIQEAHAMAKLGQVGSPLPGKLVYIQPVDYQTPMWGSTVDMFPKPGEPLCELVEYTEKEISEGRGKAAVKKKVMMPKKVLPSRTAYDLQFNKDGFVSYRNELSKGKWTDTPVSIQGIEDFYSMVDSMGWADAPLGPRPISLKSCGDFENYTMCQYCELSSICDRLEKQPKQWFDEIHNAITTGTLKK